MVNVFEFNGNGIDVLMTNDVDVEFEGEFLMSGRQVAEVLGYSDTSQALRKNVDEDDRIMMKNSNLSADNFRNLANRGETFLTESGVYALIFGSTLDSAKQFKRWVTKDVLPQIRKTGGYSNIPKSFSEALRLAADLEEKNEILLLDNQKLKPKTRGNKDTWKSKMRDIITRDIYNHYTDIDNPYGAYSIVYGNFDNFIYNEADMSLDDFRKEKIQESINESCGIGYISKISQNVLESISIDFKMRNTFETFLEMIDGNLDLSLRYDSKLEE